MKYIKNLAETKTNQIKQYKRRDEHSSLEKGITLIALIVTITVSAILAVVAIQLALGDNKIIDTTMGAKEKYQNAQEYEETEIEKITNHINTYISGNRDYETEINLLNAKIKELEELVTYKILYTNNNGWSSGEIVVEGINEYEEIGVYISLSNTSTNDTTFMVRCSYSEGQKSFVGDLLKYQDDAIQGCALRINLTPETETLSYLNGGKWTMYEISNDKRNVRTTAPIYKIVGLTKKSQIN